MSVATILSRITDDFIESGVPATILLGRPHLAERPEILPFEGTFLRIVVVPTTFAYGPPLEIGGNPRRVANRKQTLEIHLQARASTQMDPLTQHSVDLELAEALADQFVLSFFRYAEGSFKGDSGKFNADPQTLSFGVSVQFDIDVDIPVVDAPWTSIGDADPTIQGAAVNAAGADVDLIGVG